MAFSVSARTAAEDARTTDVGPVRIPGQPGRLARYEGLLVGSAAVLVFVAVWQLAAFRRLVPELFLPGPMDIANAFGAYIAKGQIWPDMWISGQELMYGFALSIVVGLPVGMLMGWYRRLNEALDPFVTFFYSIPRVALTPLLIVWFGIGINSKIAVVFLGAIFAIVINTAAGVRNLDPALIKAARSFGASDAQLFRTIVLPGSVPFILTGLRLGLGHALTGVVVGELVAAQAGVGMMMATAGATFQTSKVFVGLVIFAVWGLVMTNILSRIEQRFQSWKPNPT
ncbi:MAG: ABC transporter permease [Chloroflexi bacterium]|nr:MAG: ABC transporter permease [Chloroflexota bacterium]